MDDIGGPEQFCRLPQQRHGMKLWRSRSCSSTASHRDITSPSHAGDALLKRLARREKRTRLFINRILVGVYWFVRFHDGIYYLNDEDGGCSRFQARALEVLASLSASANAFETLSMSRRSVSTTLTPMCLFKRMAISTWDNSLRR